MTTPRLVLKKFERESQINITHICDKQIDLLQP